MAMNTRENLVMRTGYNENCSPQLMAADTSTEYIHEAVSMLNPKDSSSLFIIADFGSSHGRNSIHVIKMIIHYLKESKKIEDEKQVLVVHNDLPSNDWTTLFDLLNKDNSYKNVANGRSFFESCLPSNCVSIAYSSSSIHWLPRKPCNISDHCVSQFAQGNELKSFQEQSRLDWIHFLKYRSDELIDGGLLILVTLSVDDHRKTGFDILVELLYQCARSILTPQELIDFTLPTYVRSYSELRDDQLFAQCSFQLIKFDCVIVQMPFIEQWQNKQITLDEFIRSVTLFVCSWSDSILKQTLLRNNRPENDIEQILKQFWSLYEYEARKQFDQLLNISMNYIYLILKKNEQNH